MPAWRVRLTDLALARPMTDAAPLLHFGRWDDQPHQHLPAARMAASPWKGVLVADEVGLGKTISAIRALRRMHANGERGAVIIACPGGLRSKWRQELWHRADIEAEVATSGRRLLDMVGRLRAGEPRVCIVSHGVLRRSETLQRLAEDLPELMFTIVDEAHHCRNPRSRLHDAVQLLSMRSRRVMLLTATPVNLREEELWVQLSLLAPDRWPTLSSFHATMRPTRMLNEVLDAVSLTEPDLERALSHLHALGNTVGFAGDPRLELACDLIEEHDGWQGERLEANRSALADLVRSLRPLNDLLVRTRRRDLDIPIARRDAITLDIQLSQSEWRLYDAARRWSRRLVQMRHPTGEVFDWALIVPERMASSCLPAFARHVLRQLRTAARDALDFEEEAWEEEMEVDGVEMRLLRRLGDFDRLVDAAEQLGDVDTKYEALRTWLTDSLAEDDEGGVLLFSHFIATLEHLRNKLTADGVSCQVLTGRTPMAERDKLREAFARGEFDVLLSSEVGSEGLDQQQCHRLVNYDLPWNPMRIEQRIGRLDRFGQEAEVITILNMAVEGTIDAAILHRLYHRIRLFEDSLGMLDPLLGQAMRMVANNELNRLQLVRADEAPPDPEEDEQMMTLLEKRDRWLEERAIEERQWLGPDPGIAQLREATLAHRLDLAPADLCAWMMHRFEARGTPAQLHPTAHPGMSMLRLPDEAVAALANRATDPYLNDRDTVGWEDLITRMAGRSGPHWLHVVFERDACRNHPDTVLLAPWHPIIQWLRETRADESGGLSGWQERQTTHLLAAKPRDLPAQTDRIIALDWVVQGLSRRGVRRWLALDAEGIPLPLEVDPHALEALSAIPATGEMNDALERSLDQMHSWLLEDEQRRISPLLAEVRRNAEKAWHERIKREKEQLADADWRARNEGREPDPRWVRMKESLIEKLHDELANRLLELDQIAEGMHAEIGAPLVIHLRD